MSSSEFVQHPFVVRENGIYPQVDFFAEVPEILETTWGSLLPVKTFTGEIARVMSLLILHPHILFSTEEWVVMANSTTNAASVLKSRFKKYTSQHHRPELFPRAGGQIFTPAKGTLEVRSLPKPIFFNCGENSFVVTENGQFIHFYNGQEKKPFFEKGVVHHSENAEYLLLPPRIGFLLHFLAQSFEQFILYEEIISAYYQFIGLTKNGNEIDYLDQENLNVIYSHLKTVLPLQLRLQRKYGKSMAIMAS